MVALTVVAVVAAPLIFRLYTLNLADDVDADLFRRVGTTLTRIFLVQILFYGLTGIANAYLNSRRRFFAAAWSPILPNLIIIVTLLVAARRRRHARGTLGDVLTNDRLRWTLGLGATAGIAAMALAVVPRDGRRRAAVPAGVRVAPPGGPQAARPVGVDARLRRRQPGRARGRAEPGRSARGQASQPPTSRRSPSSCCPTVCWRCRSPRRSSPRWRGRSRARTAPTSSITRRSASG